MTEERTMKKLLAMTAAGSVVVGSAMVWTAPVSPEDVTPVAPSGNESLISMVAAAADAQSQELVAYGQSSP